MRGMLNAINSRFMMNWNSISKKKKFFPQNKKEAKNESDSARVAFAKGAEIVFVHIFFLPANIILLPLFLFLLFFIITVYFINLLYIFAIVILWLLLLLLLTLSEFFLALFNENANNCKQPKIEIPTTIRINSEQIKINRFLFRFFVFFFVVGISF